MQSNPYNYRTKIDELLSTGRNKSYAVAAVTVFFVLLMSFAGIIPAVSSLGIQAEENKKREEIISKLERKLGLLKDFVREREEKKDVLGFFEKVFPSEPKQVEILQKLSEISERHNTVLLSYSFQKPTLSDENSMLPIEGMTQQTKFLVVNINGYGGHSDLIEFAKSLESSTTIFNVEDLLISRLAQDAEVNLSGGYTINAKLRIYYYDINFDPNAQTSV